MSLLPQGPTSSIRTGFAGVTGLRGGLAWSLSVLTAALMVLLVPLMLYLMIAVTMLALMVGMFWVMIVLLPLHKLLG